MCNFFLFYSSLKSGNECYLTDTYPNIFHGLSLFLSILHCCFHFVSFFIPSFSLTIIFFPNGMLSIMWIFQAYFPLSLSFHISWRHGSLPWTCWWQVKIVRICDIYTGCFTTCGHYCRSWFPRSLWSKSSYKHVSDFGRLRSYGHF